jgi:hypothetical protein
MQPLLFQWMCLNSPERNFLQTKIIPRAKRNGCIVGAQVQLGRWTYTYRHTHTQLYSKVYLTAGYLCTGAKPIRCRLYSARRLRHIIFMRNSVLLHSRNGGKMHLTAAFARSFSCFRDGKKKNNRRKRFSAAAVNR